MLAAALGADAARGEGPETGESPSAVTLASWATDSCGEDCCGDAACGGCGGTCGGGLGLGGLAGGKSTAFYGGADYLYVRPNFSDALAFTVIETPDVVNGIPGGRTYEQLDFDYESGYRWFVGIRDICCGHDLQISGANIGGNASISRTIEAGSPTFQTPFPTFDGVTFTSGGTGSQPGLPPEPGNSVIGSDVTISADVDMNYWDITCSRTIPLGSPLGEPRGCGPWCPAWDVTWTGGVRIADGGWNRNGFLNAAAPNASVAASESLNFTGAGGLFGLTGRRYFGRSGIASVFARGNVSVLLGDVSYDRQSTTFAGAALPVFDRADFTRIVPVIDIELGGSVNVTECTTLSAGYLFQSWHDLGMGAEVDTQGTDDLRFDDANILGFDGFFIRGEVVF